MSDAVVILLAKPPVPGLVKTRIGKELGMEPAARLARALTLDTWEWITDVEDADCYLSTTDVEASRGLVPDDRLLDQGEGDLGDKIERLFRWALQRAPKAIVVGGDVGSLHPGLVRQCIGLLDVHPAAIGPSEDGGYYILGVRSAPEGFLAGLPWSQPETLEKTLQRLREHLGGVGMLPEGWDVDTRADVQRLATQGRGRASVVAREILTAHTA